MLLKKKKEREREIKLKNSICRCSSPINLNTSKKCEKILWNNNLISFANEEIASKHSC
jgi:hypothetical protein